MNDNIVVDQLKLKRKQGLFTKILRRLFERPATPNHQQQQMQHQQQNSNVSQTNIITHTTITQNVQPCQQTENACQPSNESTSGSSSSSNNINNNTNNANNNSNNSDRGVLNDAMSYTTTQMDIDLDELNHRANDSEVILTCSQLLVKGECVSNNNKILCSANSSHLEANVVVDSVVDTHETRNKEEKADSNDDTDSTKI